MGARSSQLRPLLALRWRMVRNRGTRVGFALFVAAIPLMIIGSVLLGVSVTLPPELQRGLTVLLPTLYAGFAILAVATPIAAGGGNELFPSAHMVAFPITVRTRYHSSLVLAPLNLGWFVQVAALLGITAVALGDLTPRLGLGLLPVLCYLVLVSLLGQAVAWGVMGLRQTRRGRLTVWATLAAALLAIAALIEVVGATRLLDNLPTVRLLTGALQGYYGHLGGWLRVVLVLLVGCLLAYLAGFRACAWALSRVGDVRAQPEAQPLPRRSPAPTLRGELLRVDRRSVWRSAPLRRGLALMAVLPTALVLAFRLEWVSLILIPGVVAAGSGLLFGINVFALDGSGAVWIRSQPLAPQLVFWSKARALGEVCAGTVAVVLLAGAARAVGQPSPTRVVAVFGAALAASTWVIATSLRISVTHPHRADLRGPRDTPAPPGIMAVYSLRLAVATALIGLLYTAASLADSPAAAALLTVGFLLVAAFRLRAAGRRYRDPGVVSWVTTRVSSG